LCTFCEIFEPVVRGVNAPYLGSGELASCPKFAPKRQMCRRVFPNACQILNWVHACPDWVNIKRGFAWMDSLNAEQKRLKTWNSFHYLTFFSHKNLLCGENPPTFICVETTMAVYAWVKNAYIKGNFLLDHTWVTRRLGYAPLRAEQRGHLLAKTSE
jgi:hypothetical protein